MDAAIVVGLQKAKPAFPGADLIVFGSQARGSLRPGSDLDVCALFPTLTKDAFELAYDVSTEIHRHLDLALDVVVCDRQQFNARSQETWTLEYQIRAEGVTV